ncbi:OXIDOREDUCTASE 2OG-FE II OXYGENASE FAMILY PROTEIN [Salix purpurea]|uniref:OXIDOREDUCTASE 2OG-FE II OXYGENASE FAMILY PROTEIN n=1 Tax=Salix purpurea TaxID=77065 RepID=A0A9Q0TX79_SALPP|nr:OXIDOREDUCTASE 2OG-FE II OXYGENASE FAMILY PROTEIN [Salix purpurea]
MVSACDSSYDRTSELKAFDDTKAGVKGLVDAGITRVPRIFHDLRDDSDNTLPVADEGKFRIPVIDLEDVHEGPPERKEIVDRVRNASETWGFFAVVNHGIPADVLGGMKDGVRGFFEQDVELKKQHFSRDYTRKIGYNSNFDLFCAPSANWRDTFTVSWLPVLLGQKSCQQHSGEQNLPTLSIA